MEFLIAGLIWLIPLAAGLFSLVVAWRFMRAHENLVLEVYEIRVLCKKLAEEDFVAKRLAADRTDGSR